MVLFAEAAQAYDVSNPLRIKLYSPVNTINFSVLVVFVTAALVPMKNQLFGAKANIFDELLVAEYMVGGLAVKEQPPDADSVPIIFSLSAVFSYTWHGYP